jgi:fatty acid desaturase
MEFEMKIKKRFSSEIHAQIRPLVGANDWHSIVYLAMDYGLIALAIYVGRTLHSSLVVLGAMILIASRMRALDNFVHEASHQMLFRHRTANTWVTTLLCAYPIGTSYFAYVQSHNAHHRNTGGRDDPCRRRQEKYDFHNQRQQSKFLLRTLLIFWDAPVYLANSVTTYIKPIEPPRNEKQRVWQRREILGQWLYWLTMLTVLTIGGWWWIFLLYWIVPYLTFFQVIRKLAEHSEHNGLWEAPSEIEVTRNNFCHPLLRFLIYPHGDSYHLTHHLFSRVPHYRLRHAHQILLQDADYVAAHHCYGYFRASRQGSRSTLEDVVSAVTLYTTETHPASESPRTFQSIE